MGFLERSSSSFFSSFPDFGKLDEKLPLDLPCFASRLSILTLSEIPTGSHSFPTFYFDGLVGVVLPLAGGFQLPLDMVLKLWRCRAVNQGRGNVLGQSGNVYFIYSVIQSLDLGCRKKQVSKTFPLVLRL